ncbi:MAG: hypothetical protein IT348_19370 [Candidatus Eisenbacteria bacterium]|nr:hypothetical protein [Candidatus Eisenbacteria bacterium]
MKRKRPRGWNRGAVCCIGFDDGILADTCGMSTVEPAATGGIRMGFDWVHVDRVARAIYDCPRLFDFARHMRAINVELGDIDGTMPGARELEVRGWHEVHGAGPFCLTWMEFLRAFPKVKYPVGSRTFERAVQQLNSSTPEYLPTVYGHPEADRLLGLTWLLARLDPNRQFYLSCRKAAAAVGIDRHATAADLLHLLVADGWLAVVKAGVPGGKRATRYRFAVRVEDWLSVRR